MEGMLTTDARSLDVVLSTTEIIDLIESEKAYFDSIVVDPSAKVNWHPDDLIYARVAANAPLSQDFLQNYRIYTVESHPFFTPSTVSATSNNYINQVLIKAVFDKTGVIMDESSIKETLRRNKKGFGVGSK